MLDRDISLERLQTISEIFFLIILYNFCEKLLQNEQSCDIIPFVVVQIIFYDHFFERSKEK